MEDTIDWLGSRYIRALLVEKIIPKTIVAPSYILPGVTRRALEWTQEFIIKTKTLPSEKSIEEQFHDLPEEIENLAYLEGQLHKRFLNHKLTTSLKRAARHLDSNEPDKALIEIKQVAEETKTGRATEILRFSEGLERIEKYESGKESGITGILTPWHTLDRVTGGFQNGSLSIILAKTNVGKSWLSCILANCTSLNKKKVLFVVLEGAAINIARRLDALRYKVNFGKLKNFELDEAAFINWKNRVAEDTESGEILLADKSQVRTVLDIMNLIQEHKPDFVVVDGGYRLEGRTGKNSWEQMTSVILDLQTYAEASNVPWVITTQLGNAEETGKETHRKGSSRINLYNARYAREWSLAPDVVLGLYQSPEGKVFQKMEIQILKLRDFDADNISDSVLINWNLSTMDFKEVFSDSGSVVE